jgi:hypothetical protein
MPRGGLRHPAGGRPIGSGLKEVKRDTIRATRFTPDEWVIVEEALPKYGGRKTGFMRDAVMQMIGADAADFITCSPEENDERKVRTIIRAIRLTPEEWTKVEATVEKLGWKPAKFMRQAILHMAIQVNQEEGYAQYA